MVGVVFQSDQFVVAMFGVVIRVISVLMDK